MVEFSRITERHLMACPGQLSLPGGKSRVFGGVQKTSFKTPSL